MKTMLYIQTILISWAAVLCSLAAADQSAPQAHEENYGTDAVVGSCRLKDMVSPEVLSVFDSNAPNLLDIHRNGETKACGKIAALHEMLEVVVEEPNMSCRNVDQDKYHVESILTEWFAQQWQGHCESQEKLRTNTHLDGFYGFCDMGEDFTPPQPDSDKLVKVPSSASLPCRFYTREGLRIASFTQLAEIIEESKNAEKECVLGENGECEADGTDAPLELYAVPAGRVFMFAPKFVGETFTINHVKDSNNEPLQLEVLSVEPRVFDIHNFFSDEEAEGIIGKALAETSATHGFHRSTTGTTGASIFNKRTSENAWLVDGVLAKTVKRRCLSALGFDEYYESHTDGLQILRYNLTNAYTPHMDYLTDAPKEAYDYRSGGRGGNRFATILMYMSDIEEGGETVFSRAPLPGIDDHKQAKRDTVRELRKAGEIPSEIKAGSWEEDMVGACRTSLNVVPKKSRAVLFYSQYPNGQEDPSSFHGACPVLKGIKWAANLWVWNAARAEFEHAPHKFEPPAKKDGEHSEIHATFHNTGRDKKFENAKLFWQDQYFGDVGAGEKLSVNTYVSHVWNIKNDAGQTLHSFSIDHGNAERFFTF